MSALKRLKPALAKPLAALALCGICGLSFGCGGEGSPFVGNEYVVGCGNAEAAVIETEVFDLRPHNNCGRGLISYTETVTSESGDVVADLQIGCGVGFCIGSVRVLSWSD